MDQPQENRPRNPLGYQPIGQLLPKFAIPSIVSFLVSALYNIVDQIFIGQGVGQLGNAATTVAFPLVTICTALALLLGVGSASNFNLRMGEGRREEAQRIAGTGLSAIVLCGCILAALVMIFLKPLLLLFGATSKNLPYALIYTRITALGYPLVIFSTASSQLIRADGSPTYSMSCQISGALLNTLLDYLFVFPMNMGMAGAAWATVLGQLLAAVLALRYFFHFRSFPITRALLRPRAVYLRAIASLGMASCFNQLAMMVVQITLNNVLKYYGGMSVYGEDIPLACVGIITKVNTILMGVLIGTAQGCQPIVGFNYGAKNYSRVRKTYLTGVVFATAVSVVAFVCFQLFPRSIVSIFGQGSEAYFHFAERYFRIYMFMTFLNGIQPLTSNFFTSIGKAKMGIFISMTRQILFLLPLILLFPMLWGIDGVMYAGPIADLAAGILAILLVLREMRIMARLPAAPAPPIS